MSNISYNGVLLPFCNFTQFDQKAIYDDSETDRMYTKFEIKTQVILNTDYVSTFAPQLVVAGKPVTDNPAVMMNLIRKTLLTPRRAFQVTFNGINLIPVITSQPGTVDAKNGPIPQAFDCVQLTNTMFLCNYHIIAHYWDNPVFQTAKPYTNQVNPAQPVISNRWEETVDMDELQLSRRTRKGKVIIRSDNKTFDLADTIRYQMAVVGVPPGFIRQQSTYTVSPDGLSLAYTIIDKEQFKMPPSPAFKAKGNYWETSTKNGGLRWGQCQVTLWGDKTTDQSKLVQTAVAVVSSKLVLAGAKTLGAAAGGNGAFSLCDQAAIRVNLYENEVEVFARVMMKPNSSASGKGRLSGIFGFKFQNLVNTPGSDGVTYTPNYDARGSADLLLQAAAYYDPSIAGVTVNTKTGQLTRGLIPGQAGTTKEP